MNPAGERIVRANGVDLCAETFGDPADPAILLIHRAGNTMLSWDEELCERLAAGRRIVVRLFPYAHGVALADEIAGAELLALEHTGHEYFPRATWDVVVPAIVRHTAQR